MGKVLISIVLIALAYLLRVWKNRTYVVAKVEVYNSPRNGKEWFVKCKFKSGDDLVRDFRTKKQAQKFAAKLKNAQYVI